MFPLENSTEDLKFPGKLFVFNNAELVQENSVSGETDVFHHVFWGRGEKMSISKRLCVEIQV